MSKIASSIIVRRSPSSLLALEGVGAIPMAIWIAVSYRTATYWPPIIVLACWMLGIYVWFRSFSIQVSDGTLQYHSLFGGSRVIPLSEIKRAAIEVGISKYTDRFRPLFRLSIVSKDSSFDINLKVFNKEDLQTLFMVLHAK